MADRIVLQKMGVAFAPAQKITPLKRENRDSEKRRFERQLKEKKEKKQEDTIDLDPKLRDSVMTDDRKDEAVFEDENENRRSDTKRGEADMPPLGSVVDIRV
ncbi:MAG: hypothetical protein JRL30_25610 [Deltaproteobacteria bacterium]|nr:hypothetical protein [Deltaproteobacteria bacterium]